MILDDLEAVLAERRSADPAQSCTARLLADPELVRRKIMEEAFEVCLELGRDDHGRVAEEAADLVYRPARRSGGPGAYKVKCAADVGSG